ncbi:uncharacterized protein LOC121400506 [Xenopus laevis]|uniref:Uncharacterized protein LOC121400506 n=1 Tax=Xenopus laevis TaxID=8355 RepID=A0A8J1MDL0_XENLA|nr:uncharacterized protein LOC121400506 [Xenopus laevis]
MIEKFLAKGYEEGTLEKHRQEVRAIPRQQLLEKKMVETRKSPRIPFISTFDVNSKRCRMIVLKYWGLLGTDPRYGKLFQAPPLFSYRRGKNVGDLVKTKPKCNLNNQQPMRSHGTFPCRNCGHCSGIIPGEYVTHPLQGSKHSIKGFFTCDTSNVIYCLKCPCGLAYVGQTSRSIKTRLYEHKSTIRNYQLPAVGQTTLGTQATTTDKEKELVKTKRETLLAKHFFTHGQRVAQLRWQVLEKVMCKQGQDIKRALLQRECYWIWALQSRAPKGLNEEYNMSCYL